MKEIKTELKFLILVLCQLALLIIILINMQDTYKELARLEFEVSRCSKVCESSLIPMGDYYRPLKRVPPVEVEFSMLE